MDNPLDQLCLSWSQTRRLVHTEWARGWLGYTYEPVNQFNPFVKVFSANYQMTSDPKIDANATAALHATTVDEMKAALTDAKQGGWRKGIFHNISASTEHLRFLSEMGQGYNGQMGSFEPQRRSLVGFIRPDSDRLESKEVVILSH